MSLLRRGSKMAGAVVPLFFYNGRASMFKPPCNAKPLIINVRCGSTTDSRDLPLPRLLSGVKRTETARKRTCRLQCLLLRVERTYRRHGLGVRC